MKIAIVGTRDPSQSAWEMAKFLAAGFSRVGYTIATGGALGIDHAAMEGAEPGHLVVYLPWQSYNAAYIPAKARQVVYNQKTHFDWEDSVARLHPKPEALTRGARALMARNYGIVYGSDLLIAFPRERGPFGGTWQSIRIAEELGIRTLIGDRDGAQTALLKAALEFVGNAPEPAAPNR